MSSYVSNSISGGISFNGIGSGTDFDAMVSALKAVEEIPSQRMTLWKGEWEYRIAAMEEVLLVMGEAKSAMSDFSSMSKMLDIKVDSSKDEVATATINSNSNIAEGNYTIDVKQIARANLYSTLKKFPEKTTVINDTTETQEFAYTYKGTTRKIEVASGTTLDQLLLRINNDAQNPGVRASLIKTGDEYMFQVQGEDTGFDSKLSISSSVAGFDNDTLFTAEHVSINTTGADETFSMHYGGKSLENMSVPAGMTAGEFVETFNADPKNPGVTASLVRKGSDYVIEYRDKASKQIINPPTTSKIPALGGSLGFDSANAIVNNSTDSQNYTYSYAGKEYTVPVAPGLTLSELATTINDHPNTPPGLTAAAAENPPGSGKFSISMTATDTMLIPEDGVKSDYVYVDKESMGHKFSVEPGTSMDDYVTQFNDFSKTNGLGVTVEAVTTAGPPQTKKLQYKDGNSNAVTPDIKSTSTPNIAGILAGGVDLETTTFAHDGGASSTIPGFGEKAVLSGKDTVVNSGPGDQAYSFKHGGKDYSVNVPAGTTLDGFVTLLNGTLPAGEIQAKVVKSASGYSLGFADAAGAKVTPTDITTNMELLKSGGNNWNEQEPQDAIVKINGWPEEIISSSNKLTEVIEGMTITIKSEGETQLNIVSDTSVLEENITLIVESLNLVKGTILKLQEVDTDKQVGSPDEVNADGAMNSQFTWQSGSALTGNYGVQMLLSGFSSITSSSAHGFTGMSNTEDTLNDPFTALSHLGISTVTNPAEDDFGLLTIDYEKLDEAIEKDAIAVAELFSAQLSGTTTSSDFTVASAGTVAKAGTYDVKYDVDEHGSVTRAWINGVEALNDPAYPGRFTVADSSNDALGVAIQFNSSGLSPGSHTDDIRIKQGKVNEMITFLNDELKRSSLEGEPQGTLPTIISNYNDIATNLQKKVDAETKRIAIWEKRKKLEFARLDALLGEYDGKLTQISSMMPTNAK